MEIGKYAKILAIVGGLLVVVAVFLAWVATSGLGAKILTDQQTTNEVQENIESTTVTRIIDGDTVEIADGRRVRYTGINSPEKGRCFADQATMENKQLVLNKKIRLEKDASNRDKYGRLLRYIYVQDESGQEIFVNDLLVRQGFAKVLSIPPDLHFEAQFNAAMDEAKFQQRGLWSACN